MDLRIEIGKIISEYIMGLDSKSDTDLIIKCLKKLLGNQFIFYSLKNHNKEICKNTSFTSPLFSLAKINEKGKRQKKEGVYYTDSDVADFSVYNSFYHYINNKSKIVLKDVDSLNWVLSSTRENIKRILYASVFDPTCGTGEFLLSALKYKINIWKIYPIISLEEIVSTIFGNDIDLISTEISKIRIFFMIYDLAKDDLELIKISRIIDKNFTNADAVCSKSFLFKKKDIIVGNPPYVEYRKYDGEIDNDFGNVYADVLKNSIDILSNSGIMSFVIPLSYVSTIRMASIRKYIHKKANKQIVLNFADRPDCLFSQAHQKLTILFAQKGDLDPVVLSSSYKYWYESERNELFRDIELSEINSNNEDYWPKIGNEIEREIYSKFYNMECDNAFSKYYDSSFKNIYINQRACFWMKVFTYDKKSNSYTKYKIPQEKYSFVYCLLNSSLFFLLWIIISDGWHITNKELKFAKVPPKIKNKKKWDNLRKRLENKLEETKVYIGSKQVDYEYKHKECKDIIDEIDDELAKVFHLSKIQCEYAKNFGLKYRISNGV